MEINLQTVLDTIEQINDSNEVFLIIRLYEQYLENKDTILKETRYQELSLLNIQVAYKQIKETVSKNKINSLKNKRKMISKYLMVLDDLMFNFDKTNSSKLLKTIITITYLECLLELPTTFPSSIDICLETKLLINNNKNKNKRK